MRWRINTLQWGDATTSGSAAQADINFLVSFSLGAFSVMTTGTQDNDATALNELASITRFIASNVACNSNGVVNRNTTFYWLAIGQ